MSIAKVSSLLMVCGLASAASAQVTISHSSNSATISPGNSVACAAQQPPAPAPAVTQQTTPNTYYRSYTLSAFPVITGGFNVTSVTFGVEQATHPNLVQDIRVRLYTDANGGAPVGPDLTQVAEVTVQVPDGAAQLIMAPITASFAQTDVLVVSVDSPDYVAQYSPAPAQTAVFFVGSNADPETGPSYLQAAACTVNAPTTTATIGFPNMHIILDVTGTVGASCYPDCDGDTVLTLADFGCFQTAFGLGQNYADCDGDTLLTLADFGCFQTAFGLGCP